MSALAYSWSEAVASLWRGRQTGLLSTATIGIALFVLGASLIVTTNLERLGVEWSRSAEMSVYLQDEATPEQRTAIEAQLQDSPLVEGFESLSKDDALERFRQTFADLAGTLGTLDGGNPLPASYEVHLAPAGDAVGALDALVARLSAAPGVSDVRYDRQWLDRLLTAVGLVRGIGLALGAILAIAAALTVANVVRLALFARRDEIEIMQLVGAPHSFVRGPFVVEGILQGGIGALLALAALAGAFLAVRGRYLTPLAETLNWSGVQFLPLEWCVLLLAGGMAVGCVGGFVAAVGRT